MSQHTCETIRVKTEKSRDNPEGVVIINLSDFDKEVHELFDAPAKEVKEVAPVAPANTTADTKAAPWAKP